MLLIAEQAPAAPPDAAALPGHPLVGDLAGRLRYQPVVTREPLAGALPARIPELIRDGRLEAAVGLPLGLDESRVMICGSPEMVRDCHKALMERGFRLSRLAAPAQIAVETTSNRPPTTGVPAARPVSAAA